MKTLLTELKLKGRTLKQIKREGNKILYELWNNKPCFLLGYELHLIEQVPDRVLYDRFIAAHEKSPKSEQWGTYGWTFRPNQKEKALKAFLKLPQSRNKKL